MSDLKIKPITDVESVTPASDEFYIVTIVDGKFRRVAADDMYDTLFGTDIQTLRDSIEEISTKGIDASSATVNQIPVADGSGSWAWGEVEGVAYDDTAVKARLTAIEAKEAIWDAKPDMDDIPTATIAENTAARHTHDNKTVLDTITAADVSSWNGKQDALSDSDKQAIADLHADKVTSVNGFTGAVTVAEYDDTAIRNLIAAKADTAALSSYGSSLSYSDSTLQLKNGSTVLSEVSISSAGSSPAILNITTTEFYSMSVTAAIEGGETVSGTFSASGTCTLKVHYIGTYTLTCNGKTKDVTVSSVGQVLNVNFNAVTIVSWANGSWEDISQMLAAHYAGEIDIADYWSVGDTRTGVQLSAMAATDVGESHAAQTVDLVIIGIKHDDLFDGSGKAAITVQQKNCLAETGYMKKGVTSSTYYTTDPSPYTYANSDRRQWFLDNVYSNALPAELLAMTKYVSKITREPACVSDGSYMSSLSGESAERCFLLSTAEVYGSLFTVPADGTTYDYYKTSSNVGQKSSVSWWLRSGGGKYQTDSVTNIMPLTFLCASSSYITYGSQGNSYGICPAFCL